MSPLSNQSINGFLPKPINKPNLTYITFLKHQILKWLEGSSLVLRPYQSFGIIGKHSTMRRQVMYLKVLQKCIYFVSLFTLLFLLSFTVSWNQFSVNYIHQFLSNRTKLGRVEESHVIIEKAKIERALQENDSMWNEI